MKINDFAIKKLTVDYTTPALLWGLIKSSKKELPLEGSSKKKKFDTMKKHLSEYDG